MHFTVSCWCADIGGTVTQVFTHVSVHTGLPVHVTQVPREGIGEEEDGEED